MPPDRPMEKTDGDLSEQQSLSIAGKTWDRDKIWCLGVEIEGYEHVPWYRGRSFADCDVLVVDARSLPTNYMLSIDPTALATIKNEIYKRSLKHDFTLISIISDKQTLTPKEIMEKIEARKKAGYSTPLSSIFSKYGMGPREWSDLGDAEDLMNKYGDLDNYFWFPDDIDINRFGSGATMLDDKWKSSNLASFEQYFAELKSYEFGISMRMHDNMDAATTRSDDLVACMYRRSDSSALIVMLPPLSTPEQSVDKVLEILNQNDATPEPEWSQRLAVPGVEDVQQEISRLNLEIKERATRIQTLQNNIARKRSFTKLLYGTGHELEDVVREALTMLGLNVKRENSQKEDLILMPSIDTNYSLCSVEIKGVKNKIKRDHLRQLGEWVDNHWSNKVTSKGVLVVNMHRMSDIKTTKIQRSTLEPDQLEYAQKQGFSIVPTHVLFDLCQLSLEGHAIDKQKIERGLIDTNGLVMLEDLFEQSASST